MEILIPRLFKQHPALRPEFLVTDNAMDINAVCAESRPVLVDPLVATVYPVGQEEHDREHLHEEIAKLKKMFGEMRLEDLLHSDDEDDDVAESQEGIVYEAEADLTGTKTRSLRRGSPGASARG